VPVVVESKAGSEAVDEGGKGRLCSPVADRWGSNKKGSLFEVAIPCTLLVETGSCKDGRGTVISSGVGSVDDETTGTSFESEAGKVDLRLRGDDRLSVRGADGGGKTCKSEAELVDL
jgi:hypothetical protein